MRLFWRTSKYVIRTYFSFPLTTLFVQMKMNEKGKIFKSSPLPLKYCTYVNAPINLLRAKMYMWC